VAESEYSQENIAFIRTHIDRIERMLRFEISANPNSQNLLRARLASRPSMPEVYLAMENGPKTQQEIAQALSLSQPTVSRICKELYDAGIVDKVPAPRRGNLMVYAWTDFEQVLGVSRIARELIKRREKEAKRSNGAGQNGHSRRSAPES